MSNDSALSPTRLKVRERLLVFARVPVLGRVKTRLAASIGDIAALSVYRELLQITQQAIGKAGVPTTVWLADTAGPEPADWEAQEWPGMTTRCQGNGDLGQRMTAAFTNAFAEGADKVAIIGTDCPGLQPEHLTQAFALLATYDVVLGPATDGGYYLLGMRQPQPELFANKRWSTARVLADTLADAERLGLQVALLPELRDVDTETDLAAWRSSNLG